MLYFAFVLLFFKLLCKALPGGQTMLYVLNDVHHLINLWCLKSLSERIGPGQVMLSNLAGQYYNSWGRKRKKIAVSHYFSTANNNKKHRA